MTPLSLPPLLTCGALLAVLAACSTTPVAPLPQPLPETLSWARQGSADGGSFLGLKTRENLGNSLEELEFGSGVRVTRVVESSPAAEAGFQVGDVVLSFGSHDTDDPGTLDALVEAATPDEEVEVEVRRGDTVFSVPVRLRAAGAGTMSEPEVLFRLDPTRSRAGWCTGRGGVVLVSSHPEGPFPSAGVPVRSVVTAIEGEEVFSDRALLRRLQAFDPGTRIDVAFVDPEGEARSTTVRLQDVDRRVTRAGLPILIGYRSDVNGEEKSFYLLDFWIIWLFNYDRQGEEKRFSLLRFIRYNTGVGELSE